MLTVIGYIGLNTYLRDGLDFRFKSYKHQVQQFGWKDDNLDNICVNRYLKNEKNIEFCRIGKDKDPTTILIGDSIAFQHFFGLANESIFANDSENILSINQGACGSLLGYSSRSDYERCEFVTKKVLDIATNTKSISTVILSMHPEYFYDKTKKPLDIGLGVTPSGNLASQESFEKYSKEVLRKLLERLKKNGKKVIFVSHPPMLNYDPKNCLTISRFRKANMSTCAMPRNIHDEYKSGYINLVNEVLKEFPEVKVFDLANMLCDSEKCWGMKNGVMLYRDGAHLSVDGSDYVAKNLYPMIRQH